MEGLKLSVHKLVSLCSCGKKNEYDVSLHGEMINTELLEALKKVMAFEDNGLDSELHEQIAYAIAKAEGRTA